MEYKIHKGHIVFSTASGARARQFFPNAKIVARDDGSSLCAVPHTLDATRVFRNKGVDVPSPIELSYTWPGRFTPYDHQRSTAGFLTINHRCFCLNGMGTGKTASAIWAADYLMSIGEVHRVLIVSPLSTLDRVWADEIFKTIPRRKFTVLHGSRQRRHDLLEQKNDFYIINHDGVAIIADALAERPDIDLIIIDECAVARNSQTKKFKMLNHVINKQHPRRCWGLTGTPTPNSPTDAYGQIKLIKPENYRGFFKGFREDTMLQVSNYAWVPRKGAERKVIDLMSPSIRYALNDCIDLPPTIRQERTCELSKAQAQHYKELMNEAYTLVGEAQVTAVNAAVLVNKLVQASCGVMYSTTSEVVQVDFGPRLALLEEIVEECDEKVIIFVPLTGALNALERELKKRWSIEVVDGSTSKSKRNQIFSDFQNKKDPHILLANAATMAHGLTLTAASTIVWYAPINSNETYTQANARIVRPGQTKITNIVHIQATTAEARIYKALAEKTRMQDVILDLAKG